MIRILFSLVLLLPAVTWAGELPPSFTAHYDVHKGIKIGEAVRRFENRGDGKLFYESDSKTTGFIALLVNEDIVEKSWFTFDGKQTVPEKYLYQRDGRKNRTIEQRFEWDKGVAVSRYDDESKEIELVPGAVDQNMYQLSLMVDLKRGLRNMEYPIVRKDKLKVFPIRHLRNERIETPLGTFETVVIQRWEKTSQTTMWCAEALQFLPVRIEHVEKDDKFTAKIQRVEGLEALRRTNTAALEQN